MYPVPTSSVHALPDDYFETTLKGRTILPREAVSNILWTDKKTKLLLENKDLEKIRLKLTGIFTFANLQNTDGTADSFLDVYGATIKAPKEKRTAHIDTIKGKQLVVTKNAEVVGTIIGKQVTGIDKGTLLIAPAYAFITPPAEHVREYLKLMKGFNRASFANRIIPACEKNSEFHQEVYVEGNPDRIGRYPTYPHSVILDGKEYTDPVVTHSWYDAAEETPETLQEAYKNAFCARPEDIGKLLLSNDDKAQVVGILVKEDVEYSSSDKRWYQNAYFCSAYDTLRP